MLAEAAKSAAGGAASASAAAVAVARTLTVATWNVAAVNNNPYEYWLTIPSLPAYEKLMVNVEQFLEHPGEGDVPVGDVFTDDMYDRLERRMVDTAGWGLHTPTVRSYWEKDLRSRKIVSEFVRDKSLGNKRLASMPDRITNTINVLNKEDGGSSSTAGTVCRPAVINMYDGDLSSVSQWYDSWESFMFDTSLNIRTGKKDDEGNTLTASTVPYEMLRPIKKSKYPDVTEEEETASLPLQTVCGAIFDAILVHMMNTVSTPEVWQPIKKTIADGLVRDKIPRTLAILERRYADDADIIALQEVSLALVERAKAGKLGEMFHVRTPAGADPARDQNSVVLLKKSTFPSAGSADDAEEITSLVEGRLGKDAPVARGDILAVRVEDSRGVPYVVASFHGDTNGLATAPVLDALMETLSSSAEDGLESRSRLVFALDANTYERARPGKQADVLRFGERYVSLGLSSCWGDAPQPSNYTTFNARTYLQPQLNKACKSADKRKGGDVNPKDFILFNKDAYDVQNTWKDNTGEGTYVEDMAFPTLTFPSDHGILATVLREKGKDECADAGVGKEGVDTCSS
uniref:Endonuclease/exonuclease/phosphatase domain-containing protein n=1 Tax=Odontella aurita TaxID=265563 RepID=A0A6U6K6R3_9STRA|mmetsp:Transcript_6032/g.17624  ORF Transcript_6032/g.17624 Transcript_6032/m.17624 type:complete len:574 (+) Transcript_6032:136-1857(+)